MAANEYYNSMNTPGAHARPYYSYSPDAYSDEDRRTRPYAQSQNSLVSSNSGYYDQYAEDIPLNSQPQRPWMHQPNQYVPPPQQPFIQDPNPVGKRRLFGWGRIPWVTCILTVCQIAVFIVELVKNGITSPLIISYI